MTEPDADELTRAWAVLSPPRSSALSSFPLGVTVRGSSCRAALDRDGLRHLLVPAPDESLVSDDRPSVLTSAIRPLAFDSAAVVHVDICCTEPDLNPEFDEVVTDLLAQVDGSRKPGATVLTALARWRRLFRSRLERGMTASARIGLFAELVALRALHASGALPSIDVWTGPFGQPHDFEAPTGCIEVKAAGTSPEPVRINGIRQLDVHDGRSLELVVLTVTPDPQGTTLTDLVDRVRTLVGDVTGFDDRLRRLGWQATGTTDTQPLAVADVLRVPVSPDLPRLDPDALAAGALPAGVVDLSYAIEPAVLVSHSVPGGLADTAASVAR